MKICLSKNSDVPLRQQLAEQFIVLITTGELRAGREMPSVRALARQLGIHYNTVSGAYQELARRGWLTRQPGSKFIIGTSAVSNGRPVSNLDQLINQTIRRAREMGFSLQELTERVRKRLLAEPPDHILVVEEEAGLREIIRQEVHAKLGCRVETCSRIEFEKAPGMAVGAQLFAPNHAIDNLKELVPQNRPCVPITYSTADEHITFIRSLQKPSIIGVASISEALLKTAQGLFAPVIARRHSFRTFLLDGKAHLDLRGLDVVFCDSITISSVSCRQTIRYDLLAQECLDYLASTL